MLMFSLSEDFLNFGCQLGENIIIRQSIIVNTLLLIHQRYVDKRHQRYCMLTFASLICLSIGIVALSDELGCIAIELFVLSIDYDFYFLIVDMQSDM